MPKKLLQADCFSKQCWDSLEQGELLFLKDYSSMQFDAIHNMLLIPILLEERLFGFVGISDLSKNKLSLTVSNLALALRHVFELWIAKENVEKRLIDISNFIPDPTYLMNKKGEVTLWNKATEEMTGWKAERILGKGNYENSIPFYAKRRPTIPRIIFNTDPLWESNYLELSRKNGTIFAKAYCPALPGGGAFLTSKTSILYDINHRQWGCVHTVRDVTHERQMEIDLHRSKYVFETITDFAGIGIILFQDEEIISYNDVFPRLFQINKEDIDIRDFLDIVTYVHTEDRYKTSLNFKQMLKLLSGPLKFQFRYQYKNNAICYFRCYAQVDECGDKPTVYFIIDDVTKQVELSQKARLNEITMFHEDRLSALGVMATGIAHELNQPLNTIRVSADSLLFGRDQGWPLDETELFDNLQMISSQVIRMSDLIQNIRVFAHDDTKQPDVLVRPNDAIHNVFSMIGSQLEVHGIKVHKDLSPNLPTLRMNLSRLEQVIMNLVVNARQALDECNHDHKQIWIRSYATSRDLIHIEVEDNATGIPDDMKVKIFDPFFTTKEVGQGTGLGLTISNSIISDLNGSIEVFNNDKGGAIFTVVIPSMRGD
ncbi:MAG: ATP-binding protein [Pseudomonadota bacterium]